VALKVLAPLSGAVVPLAGVPDPVFADALVGPGVAIEPAADATEARAPIAGTLVKVKPHAFVVMADSGQGVLVHLGIDTVKLNGQGFEILCAEGDAVGAGEVIVRWEPTEIRSAGLSAICPVVALDATTVEDVAAGGVSTGDALFTWA
jgi:glucose-specific phosphotransferase system IIA component